MTLPTQDIPQFYPTPSLKPGLKISSLSTATPCYETGSQSRIFSLPWEAIDFFLHPCMAQLQVAPAIQVLQAHNSSPSSRSEAQAPELAPGFCCSHTLQTLLWICDSLGMPGMTPQHLLATPSSNSHGFHTSQCSSVHVLCLPFPSSPNQSSESRIIPLPKQSQLSRDGPTPPVLPVSPVSPPRVQMDTLCQQSTFPSDWIPSSHKSLFCEWEAGSHCSASSFPSSPHPWLGQLPPNTTQTKNHHFWSDYFTLAGSGRDGSHQT